MRYILCGIPGNIVHVTPEVAGDQAQPGTEGGGQV